MASLLNTPCQRHTVSESIFLESIRKQYAFGLGRFRNGGRFLWLLIIGLIVP